MADTLKKAVAAFGQAYLGFSSAQPRQTAPAGIPGQELFRSSASNDAKLKQIEAQQAKLYKQQMESLKKVTNEQKKQAALKKAGTIFDLDQIQIIAALKRNVSADERLRLELQLALATDNLTQVQKLTMELAKSQGLGQELAKFLASLPSAKNPFEAWKGFLDGIETQAARIAGMRVSIPSLSSLTGTVVPNFNPYLTGQFPDTSAPGFVGPVSPQVTVNVSGSVTTSQSLIDEIRGGLNVAALSGSSANVERRIGGW